MSTRLLAPGAFLATALVSTAALATGGLETPDAGALQVGRGGAWVARADDPLAAYMNPAAMSFQPFGVHVGAHVMIQSSCYARVDAEGQPVSPGNSIPGPGAASGPEAEQCIDAVFPNPQIAAVFPVPQVEGLAFGLAVLGPHAVGNVEWPESVDYTLAGGSRTQPAPSRYMLVTRESLLIFPTFSVSYAIVPDEFSIGAGFVWGIARASFSTFTESTSSSPEDDFTRDVKAELTAFDIMVPGVVAGANWRASKNLDVGAWFRWSDAVDATTEVRLESNYWLAGGTKNEQPCPPSDAECNVTVDEEAGTLKLQIPMEAKLGVRYHHPLGRETAVPAWKKGSRYVRDPLTEDLFDVEVDFTWANNSAVEAIEVRFKEGIAVKGTPGEVPVNGDIVHDWSDVLGVRWGSDVTVLPNLLALRAGGFFESKGQRDELLNLDFHLGWKAGISAGGTVRLGPADIHLAYQHVFYGTLDNGGDGELKALSGDATTGYRSQQAVNGGRFSQQLNEVALGATFRW
jgi:hypothetical protein